MFKLGENSACVKWLDSYMILIISWRYRGRFHSNETFVIDIRNGKVNALMFFFGRGFIE